MTLLELLRQELPKRSGWPEGVNFIAQDNGGNVWGFVHEPEKDEDDEWMEILRTGTHKLLGHLLQVSDRVTAIVTCEQYEATDWDGTGLPPVGYNIEVNSPRFGWHLATVTAVTGSWVIAKYSDGAEYAGCHRCLNADGSWTDNSGMFRPIRTEAERAIDEMVRLSGVSIGAAKILYDAGYRKG